MEKNLPTADEVKTLLSYSPENGLFTRLTRPAHRTRAGETAGSLSKTGYLTICIRGENYYCHRLAWLLMTGSWPDSCIDHINSDALDNRWGNLRAATPSQNQQNRRRLSINNTSGFTGVHWSASCGKWAAEIKIDRKKIKLGYFEEPQLAHAEYLRAKERLHPFRPKGVELCAPASSIRGS